MSGKITQARAPSNIALIKYMGKSDPGLNLPANGSVSLTLDSLCTIVEARALGEGQIHQSNWIDELPRAHEVRGTEETLEAKTPFLSQEARLKVVRHAVRVRDWAEASLRDFGLEFRDPGALLIKSANTFPEASGIASSASSFAALTLAVAAQCAAADLKRFEIKYGEDATFRQSLAGVSRQGSGSSCRSFEGPWVSWEGETAAGIRTEMPPMCDLVVLIGTQPKSVSSSEAHRRVLSSPLWEGRVERVAHRMRSLETALWKGNLAEVSRLAWSEMFEMHSLFHTCSEPFTYWEPGTLAVLRWVNQLIGGARSPIVTLDAGANVHILVPAAERENWTKEIRERFPQFKLLVDGQGSGAALIGES